MHQMRYRIEDRLGINPVMLCIFTDDNPHFHPKEYCVETWGAGARTYFNTYKVMENHPDNYKNPNSVVSLIMETVYHSTHIKNKSDDEIMGLFIPIVRKLFTKGFSKEEIKVTIDFIQAHVKFGNSENYINFEQKIEKMVKYKSTDELVAAYFDTDTQILNLQKKVKRVEKKLQKIEKAEEQAEQQLKQVEQQAKQAEQQAKQAEQQAKQAEQQAKEMREEKERSILLLLSQGVQVELIAKALVVNAAEIISIQEKYKDNNPILDILKEQ